MDAIRYIIHMHTGTVDTIILTLYLHISDDLSTSAHTCRLQSADRSLCFHPFPLTFHPLLQRQQYNSTAHHHLSSTSVPPQFHLSSTSVPSQFYLSSISVSYMFVNLLQESAAECRLRIMSFDVS